MRGLGTLSSLGLPCFLQQYRQHITIPPITKETATAPMVPPMTAPLLLPGPRQNHESM